MALDAQFVSRFALWIDLARGVSGCSALSRERSNSLLHRNATSYWPPRAGRFPKKPRCIASRASLRNRPQRCVRFDSPLHERKDAPAGKLRHGAMVEPVAKKVNSGDWLVRDGRNRLVYFRNSGSCECEQGHEAILERAGRALSRSRVGLLVGHVCDFGGLFGCFGLGDQLSRCFRWRTVFLERWN